MYIFYTYYKLKAKYLYKYISSVKNPYFLGVISFIYLIDFLRQKFKAGIGKPAAL